MELSESSQKIILNVIEDINVLRDETVTKLLKIPKDPESKLWILKVIESNNLLPFGSWVDESPESMQKWLETDSLLQERHRTVTFVEILLQMTDDHALEHPELIDEFFDYVKEHKIIGTTIIHW